MKHTKINAAKKFLVKLRATNPELYNKIIQQASWLIYSDRQGKKPKDVKKSLRVKLANTPELDPRFQPDTYGLKVAIDALAGNKKEATDSKRLYNAALDSIFKDTFKESLELNELYLEILKEIKN